MANTLQCDIVSAETQIFSGSVQFLVANAKHGDVGIYHGHAPFLTALNPGPVRVMRENGEEEIYYVDSGYLEVQPQSVTILADTALRADDMDEARALEAKKAAEQAIKDQSGELDYSKAAAQLAEASAQLRTLQAIRKKVRK